MPDTAFDRDALRLAGWSDDQIHGALRRGDLVRVARNAVVPGALADDHRARLAAALLTQRKDAAASHRAAAVAHGFRWLPATWQLADEPIDVTAERDDVTRSARAGLRRRIAALPAADVVEWRGLPVTSPARTVVDLARTEPQLLAVQIADGVLTERRCTKDDLVAVCDRMVRVPHVRRARRVVELAQSGVDSPPETTARLLIVHSGLPAPETRLEIWEHDRLVAAGDLGYRQWLLWLEYDGWIVHGEREVFGSDRARDRWLARRGWEVMRLCAEDLRAPGPFLRQLESAIRDAPARVLALDPGRSPEVAAAQALLTVRRS
jgi:hypothetical protein